MKHYTRITLMLVAAGPAALLGGTDMDHRIEQAAKESYNYRAVLDEKVDVRAESGVVTLTGKVQDKDQRDLAEDTVAGLPGVVRVENDIQVVPPGPEHSDGWIAFKVRSTLMMKPNVSASTTTVDVKDGVVTLTGTADNIAQKELTELYAKQVDGVKAVRNQVTLPDGPPRETVSASIDDASITGQLKFQLVTHASTNAIKTKVSTSNGAVTIAGEADSEAEKALVTEIAQGIRGVKSVDNRMTVGR